MKITITEALAELKTIGKRVEKKVEFIGQYVTRQDGVKDPLEKSGGSVEMIRRERQSIADLQVRHVAIRVAIQKINHVETITIGGQSKTIAEWLTWRKEVAPDQQKTVAKIRELVKVYREQAAQRGWGVVNASATIVNADVKPTDVLINVDEAALAQEAETIEEILGTLDGQLSLKNATVTIDVE